MTGGGTVIVGGSSAIVGRGAALVGGAAIAPQPPAAQRPARP